MTTFIFTQAINSVNTTKNKIINTINSSPFGQYINYNKTITKSDKIIGKLSELSIQTSSYNKVIPLVYGTNRIAGNIIWFDEVKEVMNTNTTNIRIGKGQKIKQTSIEYLYYLSFAVAICKGEIESLDNVWADTTLLDLTNYKYRFYNGTEEQLPDTLIEAINGINNVSAYRGICYIVFEDFPLSEFNNRIPNFIFEITRKNNKEIDETSLENCISGINLMPSIGEYILNTEIQYKAEEQFVPEVVDWVDGIWSVLNQNNNNKIADALYSLNQITNEFKSCEYFVQHITFFGDDLDIKNCTLKPRIEFNVFTGQTYNYGYPIYTRPDKFSVGTKWNRYNTPLLSKDSDGNFRINGGTSSDNSVLSFFKELKNRNKKTVFVPEILMDIEGTPSQTLITGSIDDVDSFFTKENGYNEFILHYAELLKEYVDVFIIGKELIGLTSLQDENNNFPAVDKLIDLAKQVKEILGDNVKVSYAANFKEYHSNNEWYNLDKLWASQYIDFVGINAFFPLTNLPQTEITKDIIKNGWFSGEGYDYITVNNIQITIENKYAYKNIEYWWKNYHVNPDETITNWIPESKKIWFLEYGFRSIDGTTNEPYKKIGELPIYSTGNSNFYVQRIAIETTENLFKNSDYIENMFLYYLDLRPYPFFPNRTDIWPDGVNWEADYCLNGKTGLSNAKVSIDQLFNDAGIEINYLGDINIDEFIDGFVINNIVSVKDILTILQKVYFFDYIENNGKIDFISNKSSVRNNDSIIQIDEKELILMQNNQFVNIETTNSDDLPKKINLIFLDKNNDYDAKSVYAEKSETTSNIELTETLPVVLDENRARTIVESLLYSTWVEKSIFNFVIPIKYIFLNPSDIVSLNLYNKSYILKVNNLKIENNKIYVSATIFDNTIYTYQDKTTLNNNLEILQETGKSKLDILEIPAIHKNMIDKIYLLFIVGNELKNWNGATIYYSDNKQKTYKLLNEVKTLATKGTVVNKSAGVRPYYFDYETKLIVQFSSNIDTNLLLNIDDYELFDGVNIALYGDEIIQFKNIVLNTNGTYTVSGLLRGLFDTEDKISSHKEYENFIILNESIRTQEIDNDKINFNFYYKIVSNGYNLSDTNNIVYNIKGTNLQPFRPCHIRYNFDENNNIIITWEEKGRGYTNWISGKENISVENIEKYYIQIIKNDKIQFSTYTTDKQFVYNLNDTELPFTINICQINDLYGFGKFISIDIPYINKYYYI